MSAAVETEMQRAIRRLTEQHYTPAQPVVADIVFGDPETITVADLKPGDFVVTIPAYKGIRGYSFSTAVKTISDAAFGKWEEHHGRGRGHFRQQLQSRVMTFATQPAGIVFDYPLDAPVIVRRPAVQQLTLDEQISKLCEAVDAAERDVTADQGADVLDAGAWVEVTRAVIVLAGPEISDAAKRAVERMTGLRDDDSDGE
jgi:hypothetical protein